MNLRLLFIYFSLALLVLIRIASFQEPEPLPDNTLLTAQVRVLHMPQLLGNSQRLSVESGGRNITLILPRFEAYRYGDLLKIHGTVKTRVLDSGKVVSTIYFPKISLVKNDALLPFQFAGWIRERVSRSFHFFLSREQASLLLGIVFGINEGFAKEQKTAFQVTGVMHVIAASGMNVTLLAGFLLPLLTLFFKRQQALVITIIMLGFYAILAGLSASIVRASLMASIGFTGLLLGRQRTALLSLYLTASIMLLISPSLLGDVGFQLSFASTLGIMLLSPLFPKLPKHKVLDLIGEDFKTTLSAQVATLPIILYYFHSAGLLSVPVNLLILWTVPTLMIIGSLGALLSLISVGLGAIVALGTLPFLSYFLGIIDLFAGFSPVISLNTVPLAFIGGYYLILAAIIMRFKPQLR